MIEFIAYGERWLVKDSNDCCNMSKITHKICCYTSYQARMPASNHEQYSASGPWLKPWLVAWLMASAGLGLAHVYLKPKPLQARPKPWPVSQARPCPSLVITNTNWSQVVFIGWMLLHDFWYNYIIHIPFARCYRISWAHSDFYHYFLHTQQ